MTPDTPPGGPQRSRSELAVLAREYLLAGHLIDRAGMPQVVAEFGIDAMRDIAIDEWMGASPVYTARMQRALGFSGGGDVATIFKGMQLDIGAPPEFMDFRYRVLDAAHGEFWLDSCGALLDVEPMGDDFVETMCHHIEDPTFPATAWATNPRARMAPLHRPPRVPSDRHPHCHWTVEIEPATPPAPEPGMANRLARSRAASVVLGRPLDHHPDSGPDDGLDGRPGGGLDDYSGPFDPDLRLEDFSRPALVRITDEACLQGHLLALGFSMAVAERFGAEAAARLGRKQFIGIAGLTAYRLRRALGLGSSLADIAAMLDLHPAFRPRAYVDLDVESLSDRVIVHLGPCDASEEHVGRTWPSLMADGDPAGLAAMARAFDPRAEVDCVAPASPGVSSFQIIVGDEAHPEADEVTLARFSTGAEFVFRQR